MYKCLNKEFEQITKYLQAWLAEAISQCEQWGVKDMMSFTQSYTNRETNLPLGKR